jgi:hypothetical protein
MVPLMAMAVMSFGSRSWSELQCIVKSLRMDLPKHKYTIQPEFQFEPASSSVDITTIAGAYDLII